MPFPERQWGIFLPSLTRRGWGRFFSTCMNPLCPPFVRGEESGAIFVETALERIHGTFERIADRFPQ